MVTRSNLIYSSGKCVIALCNTLLHAQCVMSKLIIILHNRIRFIAIVNMYHAVVMLRPSCYNLHVLTSSKQVNMTLYWSCSDNYHVDITY